jgi:uncharacterized protein (TIGR02271 family)
MAEKRSMVVGVFDTYEQVKCATEALYRAGYKEDQIGIVARRDVAGTTTELRGRKAGEGAASGAVTGGILGGLLGAAASLAIPGVGPILAGGILATTFAGAATGAAAGGVLGALAGLGVPEEEARFYDEEFKRGRILLTVNAPKHHDVAWSYLRDCGAYDLHTRPTTEDQTIRLREEKLNIRKEPVQTGEVNIRKEIVTETKTVDVPVSREEVVIERKDLKNRRASGPVGADKEIRIPVSEEEVHVDKTAVDKEEIRAHKEIATDTQRVTKDVKREKAKVERKGKTDVRGNKDLPEDIDENP